MQATLPFNGSLTPLSDQSGWRDNPNYVVTIYDNLNNVFVQANIPEQFHFRIQNNWEPFFASLEGLSNTLDNITSVTRLDGASINLKLLSALIWHRMEPIEYALTLMFDSQDNALSDVTTPVMNLIAMSTPTRDLTSPAGNIFIKAPGPTIANPNNNISMKIGRFFYIDSVVIDSIDVTWHTAAEASGDFIAADVEIAFKGWYAPDRHDILSYFGFGDSGVANYLKSNSTNYASTTNGGDAPVVYNSRADIQQLTDYFLNGAQSAITKAIQGGDNLFTGVR